MFTDEWDWLGYMDVKTDPLDPHLPVWFDEIPTIMTQQMSASVTRRSIFFLTFFTLISLICPFYMNFNLFPGFYKLCPPTSISWSVGDPLCLAGGKNKLISLLLMLLKWLSAPWLTRGCEIGGLQLHHTHQQDCNQLIFPISQTQWIPHWPAYGSWGT